MGLEWSPALYEDINLGVGQTRPGGTAPNFEQVNSTAIYSDAWDIGDTKSGSFEIPHACQLSSAMEWHLHCAPKTAHTGDEYMAWEVHYSLAAAVGGIFCGTVTTAASGDVLVPETEREIATFTLSATVANLGGIGGQMSFTVERVSTTGASYSGDIYLPTVGLHYLNDSSGSVSVSVKF